MAPKWRLEYDSGNWYVCRGKAAVAHFWDEKLAEEYLRLKSQPKKKPKKVKP